jgi:hypothetical protein
MIAKMTTKNRVNLPKAVVSRFDGVEIFDVRTDGNAIVLPPFRPSPADNVREQIAQRGIKEQDFNGALNWARKTQ